MPIRPIIAISVVLGLLPGCSSTPSGFRDEQLEVVGENIDELYRRWGEPGYISQLPNSDRNLYVWEDDGCMTNVTTNADGVIQGYALSGDCSFVNE